MSFEHHLFVVFVDPKLLELPNTGAATGDEAGEAGVLVLADNEVPPLKDVDAAANGLLLEEVVFDDDSDDDPNPPGGEISAGVAPTEALPKLVAATGEEAVGAATGEEAVGAATGEETIGAAALAKKLVNPKFDAAPPAKDGAAVGGGMKKRGCPN